MASVARLAEREKYHICTDVTVQPVETDESRAKMTLKLQLTSHNGINIDLSWGTTSKHICGYGSNWDYPVDTEQLYMSIVCVCVGGGDASFFSLSLSQDKHSHIKDFKTTLGVE